MDPARKASEPHAPTTVHVDGRGFAEPVGSEAASRMKAMRGTFEMLPAPANVLLLRRVVDGLGAPLSTPPLRLAGELTSAGTLCDVLAIAAHARWAGELIVLSEPDRAGALRGSLRPDKPPAQIVRSIFVEGGNVLGALSNAPAEQLSAIVFDVGALGREEIDRLEREAKAHHRRFDEVAAEGGALTHARLFELVAMQAEEIVYASLQTPAGWFWFLDHGERLRDDGRLFHRYPVSANDLLLEGVRRLDELRFFRERIPSDNHVPVPLAGRGDPPTNLATVLVACDGRRSVLEVGRACGLPQFEVTHALYQLVRAGFLRVDDPIPETAQAVVETFNLAIAGVLLATDDAGKGAIVRDHLSKFAMTGLYEELFRGAGPRRDGTLDPDRVAQNVERLRCDEPVSVLSESLNDYVEFALFTAESHLARDAHREVARKTRELAAPLGPRGPRPADSPSRRPPAMRDGEASRPRSSRSAARSQPTLVPGSGLELERIGPTPLPPPSAAPPAANETSPPSSPPDTLPPPRPSLQAIPPPARSAAPPASESHEQTSLDGVAAPVLAASGPHPVLPRTEEAPLSPSLGSGALDPFAQLPAVEPSASKQWPYSQPPTPRSKPEPELTTTKMRTISHPRNRGRVALFAAAAVVVLIAGGASLRASGGKRAATGSANNAAAASVDESKSSALPLTPPAPRETASAPAARSASAPPSASASALAPVASVSAVAKTETKDAPKTSETEGLLRTPLASKGRRIFLDGRVIGEGGGALRVPCGAHVVKVGSSGAPQNLVIPCGGEVEAAAVAGGAPAPKAAGEASPYE